LCSVQLLRHVGTHDPVSWTSQIKMICAIATKPDLISVLLEKGSCLQSWNICFLLL
jgi:hypothetical protein